MKATLEFTLPEDQYEFDCALNGAALQAEMRAFDEWMRGVVKHGGPPPWRDVGSGAKPITVEEAWQASVEWVRTSFRHHVEAAGGFVEG